MLRNKLQSRVLWFKAIYIFILYISLNKLFDIDTRIAFL